VCDEDAPVISCLQQEYSVSLGDRALLGCSVSANPGSVLTWLRSFDGSKTTEHITDPAVNVSIKVRYASPCCHIFTLAGETCH